jgi:hypothetical protein
MELVGDADACGTGAEDDDAVLGERGLAGAGAGQHRGEVHRARALHVVVEGEHPVAVAVQDAAGVAGAEVLPVQERVGEDLECGGDVGVDEGVVGPLCPPLVPYAQIERIVQQFRPVRADVQDHRQGPGRVDPGRGGVDGELARRDVDAADAPVADAEDGLGVGGDDEVDLVGGQLGGSQGGLDVVGCIDAEVDAAWAAVLVAVLLDGLADRRGVDDREQFAEVVGEHPVEQDLVAVVQGGQVDVLVEVAGLARALPVGALGLLVQGEDPRRQQAGQPQRITLGLGERGALVQPGIAEHAVTPAGGLPCLLGGVPSDDGPGWRRHGVISLVQGQRQ